MFNFFFKKKKKLSAKDQNFCKKLTGIVGYVPENLDIYYRAFRHKSIYEKLNDNNERLEFLGDSVLDAVVANYLFNHYPNMDEGFLTKMRAKIVSRKTLNRTAVSMGVTELIQAQVEQATHQTSLGGNALEALIGAIYLDKGFDVAEQVVNDRFLKAYVDLDELEKMDFDPKSKLIEKSQKERFHLVFNTRLNESQEKRKEYICTILKDNVAIGEGVGSSKKKAEQAAAKIALDSI